MSSPPKSALVTGASAGGMGDGIVKEFHRQGFHVFATARDVSKIQHFAKIPNITLLELDIASSASIKAAVQAVAEETGGKLDVLVNNAGLAYTWPLLDVDLGKARQVFDVNVFAVVEMFQAFMPLLMPAQGLIMNLNSTASHFRAPFMGIYSASKAASEVISEMMRREAAPFGVRVMTIVPGRVMTNMTSHRPEINLPEDSLYKPIEEKIVSRLDGIGGWTPEQFGQKIVKDALRGATGYVWRGSGASFAWFVSSLPTWLQDRIVVFRSGLDLVGKT